MNVTEVLATIPLFNGLPREQYDDLAGIIEDKTFNRGQIIFSEGDPGTGFYVVVDGRVRLVVNFSQVIVGVDYGVDALLAIRTGLPG